MARILFVIWQTLFLFLPLHVWGEEQDSSAADSTDRMRDDYITASLLVVSPASEVYSMFGHCALRLNCPAHQMDYCFTFETPANASGIIAFFRGNGKGGFVPAPTADYLQYYKQEGRSVTEHRLNLTPEEKLRLWQRADEKVAQGFSHPYGYMHAQCTSMLVSLITSTLSAPIRYQQLPDQLKGSFRDQMIAESNAYPWSRFFWQSIMGPDGDDTEPLAHKLTPSQLTVAWQHATIGDSSRTLIVEAPQTLVELPADAAKEGGCSPVILLAGLLILLIAVTIGEQQKGWKRLPHLVDTVLLCLYALTGLTLTWLVLFSQQEGTSWNWYLPAFNPLPLVLWLIPGWRKGIVWCMLIILLASILSTPFIPQFDLPHALLMACLTVRLYAYILSKKKQHQ